jgi:hypothetical protein
MRQRRRKQRRRATWRAKWRNDGWRKQSKRAARESKMAAAAGGLAKTHAAAGMASGVET